MKRFNVWPISFLQGAAFLFATLTPFVVNESRADEAADYACMEAASEVLLPETPSPLRAAVPVHHHIPRGNNCCCRPATPERQSSSQR